MKKWKGGGPRPLLILLICTLLPMAQGQLVLARPPHFVYDNSKWMERVTVTEGQSLSMHCPQLDDQDVEVRWSHNDTAVTPPGTAATLLHRASTTREDAGDWRCIARNAAAGLAGRATSVHVLYLDDFNIDDEERYAVNVVAGTPFVLNRPTLVGSPERLLRPIFDWYCNDAQIYANSTHYVTGRGDLIVLDNRESSQRTTTEEERCEVTASVDGLGEIRSRSFIITRSPSSTLPARSPFSILYGPIDQDVILREDDSASLNQEPPIVFDCVPSLNDAEIRWLLDDVQLSEQTEGVRIESSGRRLVIAPEAAQRILLTKGRSRPTRKGSNGRKMVQYLFKKLECRAEAAAGRLQDSRSARLKIIRSPKLAKLPSTILRRVGETLNLGCADTRLSTPIKNYRWMLNGEVIVHSSRLAITVTSTSYGVYQCEGRNAAGVDIVQTWLQEGYDRDRPDRPIDQISEDEALRTQADEASDALPITEDKRFTPQLNDLPASTMLSLDNVGKPANDASPPQLGPTIIRRPSNLHVPAGEAAFSLDCVAQSAKSISWRVNEVSIGPSAKYAIDGRGSLTVNDVRKSDSGKYECEARNDAGVVHATATVTVEGGSLLEYGPTNQSILIGMNIEIPCQVAEEYRSLAAISWFVNGERIPTSGDQNLRISVEPKGALLIRQVGPDNIGEYRCVVKLGQKEESAAAFLKIIEKPGMSRNVKAEVVQDGHKRPKVSISWREGFDGNSALLKHVIEMRTLSTASLHPHWSNWERVVDNVPAESCCSYLLESVRPSATAQFRVLAANKHGYGMPSQPSPNVTLPQMPPAAAPTKVHATARSNRTVMVQWQRPNSDEWNGDIDGYLVRHRLEGYNVPWITDNITDGQRMNFAVEGLLVWKEYEFQVAAYNERGEGVFSPSVRATTLEGAPTQPPRHVVSAVLNSTAILITFEQPSEQFINGVNLGYKVHFRQMREVSEGEFAVNGEAPIEREVMVEPDSPELETTIGGLLPWSHMQMTVICYTAAGDGPPSEPIQVVTHESIPGPVDDLHVDNVLFSEAQVIWQRPKESNGRITRYEVRYWSESAPDAEKKTVVAKATDRNVTLLGLTASTKYVVDVRATTSQGDGPREEVRFESGVPPELPGRSSALSISNISSRSVQLSFAPGFDGHSPIRTWFVEAREGDSGIFKAVFNISAPKARTLLVTGLRPYTQYQLRLLAENVRGRGPPSEPTKIFKTAQAVPEAPSSKLWAEPLSDKVISLSWTPLQHSQWNGEPIGYLVLYRRKRALGEAVGEVEEDRPHEVRTRSLRATELTLKEDIKPWTTYEIELFAENVVGKSKSAGKILARTYEATPASPPEDVRVEQRGDRGAIVQWNDVPERMRNGDILGYTIRLVPDESLPALKRKLLSRTSVISSPDQKTETFQGLRPATTYKATISAHTLIGDGPVSQAVLVRTKDDVSGRPSKVMCTLVTASEVKIKFLPPEDPNGVITQYLVSYYGADDPDFRENMILAPVSPTLFTHSASGLIPRTKYKFGVAAQNEEGVSEAAEIEVVTAPVNETLPLANPSMPTWNARIARSSTELGIQWQPEKSMGGSGERGFEQPVRAVELEYQRANDANWTKYQEEIVGTEKGVVVKGLLPNSAYSFRIRFTGDYSTASVWSTKSEWIQTLPSAPSAPPRQITLAPEETDAVTVTFVPPERMDWNSDSIGFTLHYKVYPTGMEEEKESTRRRRESEEEEGGRERRALGDEWQTVEIAEKSEYKDGEKIRYTIKGMKGFRHYVFQLRAKNSDGSSPPSSPAFVYVGFAVPKQKVTGLLLEPLSSTSLSVRWNAVVDRDQISGFKVKYAPLLSVLKKESELDGLLVVEDNEVVIQDLMKYTEYQISVVAYNRAGVGEEASNRVSTLEDAPGPVGQLRFTDVLLNSANVSWMPPKERNGEVIGYIVQWRMATITGDTRQEQQKSIHDSFLVADQLTEGATYHFTVIAQTRAGRGPAMEGKVTVGPVPGGPSPPSRPSLIPGQSSVSLTWRDTLPSRRGEEGEGRIVGHVVQAKRVGRALNRTTTTDEGAHRRRRSHTNKRPVHTIGEWITVSYIEGSDANVEIHYGDLHPMSYYVFRIFTQNGLGVGKPSEESEQLFVPEHLPTELFYTSPWFAVIAGLSLLVLLVVVIACLCITGSSRRACKTKKSPSTHSLHYDGNFPMQLKPKEQRGRRGDAMGGRPGTNTSWLSERDMYGPPAYGAIGGGLSSGGDSGRGGSSPEQVVNMYGLATDVIPQSAIDGGVRRHDGSILGSEYGNRLPMGLGSVVGSAHHTSIYGTAAIRQHDPRDYDADSFDDDFDDEDEDDRTMRRTDEDDDGMREDIASHYAHTDNHRDAWRAIRDREAVPMSVSGTHHLHMVPPSFPAPAAPTTPSTTVISSHGIHGGPASITSHHTSSHRTSQPATESIESTSDASWHQTPALTKGMSSFV